MSEKPHKFRYLLQPGTNFSFVSKFKLWVAGSLLLMTASIASLFVNKEVRGDYMNWTIDFKGGTEMVFAFKDAQGKYTKVDPGEVRKTLAKAGEDGVEISDIAYTESTPSGDVQVHGLMVRSPRFSALKPEQQTKATTDFLAKFKDREVHKATWSGDRLFVRSQKPITNAEAAPVFSGAGLEVKPWSERDTDQFAHADEGTGEFNQQYAMWGLDRQYAMMLEQGLGGGIKPVAVQSYGVGAKAGEKLRDDAAKSLIYAIFLIMLYLAFRFDIRYAPGAAFATIHDAVMVIGVFAVTWTEVSLVSVAGLLTVIGFSVNDTVVVFDRIRENQAKLKDKKVERIIDISINEMLVRTILTSTTVFATTLVMNIFGTGLVKNFAFAMNVGVIVGVYSSIFLAAPLFLWISRRWYTGPVKRRELPASVAAEP